MEKVNEIVGGELFTVSVDGDGVHLTYPSEIGNAVGENGLDFTDEERDALWSIAIKITKLVVEGGTK